METNTASLNKTLLTLLRLAKILVIGFGTITIISLILHVTTSYIFSPINVADVSESGQYCSLHYDKISESYGESSTANNINYYLIELTDYKFNCLVALDEKTYKNLPESGEIKAYSYTLEGFEESAAYFLRCKYQTNDINATDVKKILGSYMYVANPTFTQRHIGWSIFTVIMLIGLLWIMIYVGRYKIQPETLTEDYERGKKNVVRNMILGTITAIGFHTGWSRLAALIILAMGSMRKYAPVNLKNRKFMFLTTCSSYVISSICSSLILNFLLNMFKNNAYYYSLITYVTSLQLTPTKIILNIFAVFIIPCLVIMAIINIISQQGTNNNFAAAQNYIHDDTTTPTDKN